MLAIIVVGDLIIASCNISRNAKASIYCFIFLTATLQLEIKHINKRQYTQYKTDDVKPLICSRLVEWWAE